ncbi:unnamed protein product, partial [Lymnaea stagnalis]
MLNTYTSHSSIKVYSWAYVLQEIDIKNHIFKSIKSTMSDRAKVNHCVVERLEHDLQTQLIQLNCNLNPLDGLAHAARDCLQKLETEWRRKSSGYKQNGGIVANLIHCFSKMRYKQGSGDPGGFMAFLKKRRIETWSHSSIRGQSTSCNV